MSIFNHSSLLPLVSRVVARFPTPERYSITNADKNTVNFVHLRISEADQEKKSFVVLRGISRKTYEGRWVDLDLPNSKPACVNIGWFKAPKFEVSRTYGPITIKYDSLSGFLLKNSLGLHRIIHWQEIRSRKRFNRRFKFRAERMSVLSAILKWQDELAEENGNFLYEWEFGNMDAFTHIYSEKVWMHERQQYFLAKFLFILDSLRESGELESTGPNTHRLKANALKSMSEYENELSRHQDHANHNRILIWLTAVIAVSAVVSAIVAWTK